MRTEPRSRNAWTSIPFRATYLNMRPKAKSFSLLYLNARYDLEIGSIATNSMERLFLADTYRWLLPEGILTFVIPFERLYDSACERSNCKPREAAKLPAKLPGIGETPVCRKLKKIGEVAAQRRQSHPFPLE
jgi:hypothetical protein